MDRVNKVDLYVNDYRSIKFGSHWRLVAWAVHT